MREKVELLAGIDCMNPPAKALWTDEQWTTYVRKRILGE